VSLLSASASERNGTDFLFRSASSASDDYLPFTFAEVLANGNQLEGLAKLIEYFL
jgi:hypothetical protein